MLYSTQAQIGPNSQFVVKRVNPQNLQRSTLPLLDASDVSLDATGKTAYFTRMGHHLRAENVRRYRGGAHAQLWRFALDGKQEAETHFTQTPIRRQTSDVVAGTDLLYFRS